MTLTPTRLRELLRYDPDTGNFTWILDRGNTARSGTVAGGVHPDGYRIIRVDGKPYMAHRLAWFYVTGSWPADQIDHINGDRGDNRVENLREATQGENSQNLRGPIGSNRTSRYLGVSWKSREGKWRAVIHVKKKRYELGLFDCEEDAHRAYLAAKKKLHPFQTIAA